MTLTWHSGRPSKDVCSTWVELRLKQEGPRTSQVMKNAENRPCTVPLTQSKEDVNSMLNAVEETFTIAFDVTQESGAAKVTHFTGRLFDTAAPVCF